MYDFLGLSFATCLIRLSWTDNISWRHAACNPATLTYSSTKKQSHKKWLQPMYKPRRCNGTFFFFWNKVQREPSGGSYLFFGR